jgi:simple sugar transport system substrate-binding protein
MALQIAGQLNEKQVIFPGVLVTQAFLLQEQIKNMDDLRAKVPDLNLRSTASAPWITSVKF